MNSMAYPSIGLGIPSRTGLYHAVCRNFLLIEQLAWNIVIIWIICYKPVLSYIILSTYSLYVSCSQQQTVSVFSQPLHPRSDIIVGNHLKIICFWFGDSWNGNGSKSRFYVAGSIGYGSLAPRNPFFLKNDDPLNSDILIVTTGGSWLLTQRHANDLQEEGKTLLVPVHPSSSKETSESWATEKLMCRKNDGFDG